MKAQKVPGLAELKARGVLAITKVQKAETVPVSSWKKTGSAECEVSDEAFIDKREVANRLGLRPRTVSVWVQQKKLPAYRFGRFLRFKWTEIQRRLAATCHQAEDRRDV